MLNYIFFKHVFLFNIYLFFDEKRVFSYHFSTSPCRFLGIFSFFDRNIFFRVYFCMFCLEICNFDQLHRLKLVDKP